jgi:hypothetical protein
LVEEAWLVDLFDWIETGLVWLADGAAWRRLLIFDKNLGVGGAAAEMCQSNNNQRLLLCITCNRGLQAEPSLVG